MKKIVAMSRLTAFKLGAMASPAALILTLLLSQVAADAAGSQLPAEHRGEPRSAEPFLDRIASLFGGGSAAAEKEGIPPQRPAGPVYRPPQGPPPAKYQAAASQQRPVAVPPPQQPPPRKQGYGGGPLLQTGASNLSPVSQPAYGQSSAPADPWQISQPANMAQIKDLQVQCEKDLMRVRILFDRPFYGMVFSKGHYSNINCVHVPSGLGQTQATFDIAMGQCGMSTGGNAESYGAPTPQGSFIENTVIIQYDPLLQEVWDQARKIRCTWYDFYEKAVTFKPYQVDMLDPVTANFLGDNLRCWMQIQVGKGPYASEVSGIVKIGQTMTMVLGVKDDESKFDMMVRNCVAHDGQRAPIQLVDEKGCVVREKIMSPFKKLKNFDATANVLSYAYFQAFKFPDSMNVHFQCVVQVCRNACPEPQCGGLVVGPAAPNVDSYGAPAGPALDSYGGPQAPVYDSYGGPLNRVDTNNNNRGVDPRTPNGPANTYAAGSERRVSVVRPEGPRPQAIPLKSDLQEVPSNAAITNFNKRIGELERNTVGGNPRSLEFGEGEEVQQEPAKEQVEEEEVAGVHRVAKELVPDTVEASTEPKQPAPEVSAEALVGPADEERPGQANSLEATQEAKARRKRAPLDGNGNRILRIVRREADQEETEQADIETERVIRVVAPSDVQFQLSQDGKEQEEVVINTNSVPAESLCIDTAAFVGVTISILMLLIVAIITIIFLWLRIRAIGRKNLL